MDSADTVPFLLQIDAWLLVTVLFVCMLLFIVAGSVIAKKRFAANENRENAANSSIYGAVFGLLAFLLAFTFSMSGNRYENRRQASIAEANAIGTAILRADLYPDTVRTAFRNDFKSYLGERINNILAGPDRKKSMEADKQASVYAARLWQRATDFSKQSPNVIISGQMIPALNEMFDSAAVNYYSELMRVPPSIIWMLLVLSLIVSFFLGYISVGKGKFDWLIAIGFCLLTSLVIFITLDLDRPRRGLIRLDTSHQAIISLMKQLQ